MRLLSRTASLLPPSSPFLAPLFFLFCSVLLLLALLSGVSIATICSSRFSLFLDLPPLMLSLPSPLLSLSLLHLLYTLSPFLFHLCSTHLLCQHFALSLSLPLSPINQLLPLSSRISD